MQDPRKIAPALLAKYDVNGPRYTSYPPATHFRTVDREAVFERWRARNGLAGDPGLSLYFHIPFCRTKCLFCGCHTAYTRDESLVQAYCEAMEREMRLSSGIVDPARKVRQVALGGGTPNFLSPARLSNLLKSARDTWSIQPDAEVSAEIDPRTATPEKLQALLDGGVNRFSLGVQDFDEKVLALVRRGQNLMKIEEVVTFLRGNGIEAINFDLIYGLPLQTLDTAAETAAKVIRLRPTRIALYSYAHVPRIKPHQKALEKHGLPAGDMKLSIFLLMLDAFSAAGYMPVGMDHFALPDDALAAALRNRTLHRNFMGYTTGRGMDLLGFGASSISSVGTAYSQDSKELDAYIAGTTAGSLPVERGYLLDRDDEIRRAFILDLFCNFSVDFDAFGSEFGIVAREYFAGDFASLAPLAADGLLSINEKNVSATETGRFFIRNICMGFDRHLEKDPAARPYSRTV
jgi:oxygen-independent coproporphyrinogen-3 oxidase